MFKTRKFIIIILAALIAVTAISIPTIINEKNTNQELSNTVDENFVQSIKDRYKNKDIQVNACYNQYADNFKELTDLSKFIVKATVLSVDDRVIGQIATLKVDRIYKGKIANTIELYQIKNDAGVKEDNQYLLFLDEQKPGEDDYSCYPIAGAVGVMDIIGDTLIIDNESIANDDCIKWLADNIEEEYTIDLRNKN